MNGQNVRTNRQGWRKSRLRRLFDVLTGEWMLSSGRPNGGDVVLCRAFQVAVVVGMDDALIAYEDSVLALVEEHGGTVLHRARSDGAEGRPLEVQLYEWASQAAMDSYMSDPRRTARAAERDRAVARTEIVPVRLV